MQGNKLGAMNHLTYLANVCPYFWHVGEELQSEDTSDDTEGSQGRCSVR